MSREGVPVPAVTEGGRVQEQASDVQAFYSGRSDMSRRGRRLLVRDSLVHHLARRLA